MKIDSELLLRKVFSFFIEYVNAINTPHKVIFQFPETDTTQGHIHHFSATLEGKVVGGGEGEWNRGDSPLIPHNYTGRAKVVDIPQLPPLFQAQIPAFWNFCRVLEGTRGVWRGEPILFFAQATRRLLAGGFLIIHPLVCVILWGRGGGEETRAGYFHTQLEKKIRHQMVMKVLPFF